MIALDLPVILKSILLIGILFVFALVYVRIGINAANQAFIEKTFLYWVVVFAWPLIVIVGILCAVFIIVTLFYAVAIAIGIIALVLTVIFIWYFLIGDGSIFK